MRKFKGRRPLLPKCGKYKVHRWIGAYCERCGAIQTERRRIKV